MKRIKFETSIGWFECTVLPSNEVIIDKKDYWTFKKHLDFNKMYIDEEWLKINLSDPYYGTPEYKYEIIE